MYSPLATPRDTIARLQAGGLYTKKRLGQHFLIDDNTVGRILNLASLSIHDTVLEVGPGIGTLTLALLPKAARLIAIEKDPALAALLRGDIPDPRFSLLEADARQLPRLTLPAQPTALVANLPYQVAATVVLDAFEYLPELQQATVMVQHEVAQRMAADPGGKDYGAYSAKLRLLARPTGSFPVARSSFLPPPRVDSRVIRLQRRDAVDRLPVSPRHYRCLADLIDRAFAARRKTLRNNLRVVYPEADLDAALQKAGVKAAARAETLTPADFVRLFEALSA